MNELTKTIEVKCDYDNVVVNVEYYHIETCVVVNIYFDINGKEVVKSFPKISCNGVKNVDLEIVHKSYIRHIRKYVRKKVNHSNEDISYR